MAKYEDSAAGWLVYKQHAGQIALDELNQLLLARGYRPVAPRSMSHYRKLERLGYDEYVSMNRLDIKHASDTVFDVTDRSRYEDLEAAIPATLHLPTAKSLEVMEITGQVVRMSEGFAVLEVVNPSPPTIRATKSTKYNRGVLRFETTGFERAVHVSPAIESEEIAEILLTFRSLLSTDLLFPDKVRAVSRSRLTVGLPDDPTMHTVVTALHRSFDLFESIRGIVETTLTEVAEEDRPVVASPRISSLRAGSPLIQIVVGEPVVWILAGFVIKWVLNRVKDVTEIAGNLQQIETGQNEDQRAAERHLYEIRSMQLANLKDELEVRSLLRSAQSELIDEYDIDLDGISTVKIDRLEALKDQAIEAAAELAAESTTLNFEELDDEAEDPDNPEQGLTPV